MRRGLGRQTRPLAGPLSTLRVQPACEPYVGGLRPPLRSRKDLLRDEGLSSVLPTDAAPVPTCYGVTLILDSHSVERHCPRAIPMLRQSMLARAEWRRRHPKAQ
jgi:hypothetical protein